MQCNRFHKKYFSCGKNGCPLFRSFFKGNVQSELEKSARYGEVSAIKYPLCKGLLKGNLREINRFLRSVRCRVMPAV